MEEKSWIAVGEYLDRKFMYEVIALLDKEGIPTKVETSSNFINSAYGQQNTIPDVLYVVEEYALKAKELIDKTYAAEEPALDMSEYEMEELLDITKHSEQWHPSFVEAAKEELKKRKLS